MIEFKARGQSRYYVFVNVASPPAPWQLTDPALALPAVAGGPPKYHTQAHKALERAARVEAVDPAADVRVEHHEIFDVTWVGDPPDGDVPVVVEEPDGYLSGSGADTDALREAE